MRRPFHTVFFAAAAAVASQAPAALAADVTPAQATGLEAQIRDALGGMLGPTVKLGDRPIHLTPAGDHYDVSIPVRPEADAAGSAMEITAVARPLDAGKWSVERVRTTMPLRFTLNMPVPPKDGAATAPATTPVTYTVNIAGQDGQLLLDPTFASPTTWTSSTKGGTIHTEGGPLPHDTRLGATSSVTTLRPAGPDRVDVVSDGSAEDYTMETRSVDLGTFRLGMKLVRANMSLTGLSRSRAMTITQSLAGITTAVLAAIPAPGGVMTPPKVAPELLSALLGAMQDFASEFKLEEQAEGFTGAFANYSVTMDKLRLGLGAKSEGGILQTNMEFGAEGFAMPGAPLGEMQALVPTEFALRPFASGVGVAELMRILSAASEQRDPNPADVAALFSHGGLIAGLESMSIEVGGATFTGAGKVVVDGPAEVSGSGQITAEDFDDLMEKVTAIPALAQAIPVMAFIKGIGKTVDDKLVWNIVYKDGKALVNNVDLSAMGGGGAPKPAPKATGTPGSRKPAKK